MKYPRIHTTGLPAADELITLDTDASKHLCQVLRRKADDGVILFNGDGNDYQGVIAAASKSSAVIQIISCKPNATESPLRITLVQSLAKGAKLDLIIQKATELGVHRVSPVSNDRSVLQIDADRSQRKQEHWQKIAISAATQCNRSVVPCIDPPISYPQWLQSNLNHQTLLMHPEASVSIAEVTLDSNQCSIVIGPEGGFTDHELQQSANFAVQHVQCGPRILRTETAGFAAIAILQARYGDL